MLFMAAFQVRHTWKSSTPFILAAIIECHMSAIVTLNDYLKYEQNSVSVMVLAVACLAWSGG